MKTKFKVGDIIFGFCDIEQCVHKATVDFVNYAGAGFSDINYEVHAVCNGQMQTVFVDENEQWKRICSKTKKACTI